MQCRNSKASPSLATALEQRGTTPILSYYPTAEVGTVLSLATTLRQRWVLLLSLATTLRQRWVLLLSLATTLRQRWVLLLSLATTLRQVGTTPTPSYYPTAEVGTTPTPSYYTTAEVGTVLPLATTPSLVLVLLLRMTSSRWQEVRPRLCSL